MDYKAMWDTLKAQINKEKEYHISGEMQSIAESVEGEKKCQEFLDLMESIEKEQIAKEVSQ